MNSPSTAHRRPKIKILEKIVLCQPESKSAKDKILTKTETAANKANTATINKWKKDKYQRKERRKRSREKSLEHQRLITNFYSVSDNLAKVIERKLPKNADDVLKLLMETSIKNIADAPIIMFTTILLNSLPSMFFILVEDYYMKRFI